MSCSIGPAAVPTISLGMLVVGARLQRGDSGKRLALEEFEERTARRRDVIDVVRDAEFVDRRDGVAAACDRVGLRFRNGARDRLGAFGKGVVFENADRAVPYDRAGLL